MMNQFGVNKTGQGHGYLTVSLLLVIIVLDLLCVRKHKKLNAQNEILKETRNLKISVTEIPSKFTLRVVTPLQFLTIAYLNTFCFHILWTVYKTTKTMCYKNACFLILLCAWLTYEQVLTRPAWNMFHDCGKELTDFAELLITL